MSRLQLIVGIAGASGAGKSFLARQLGQRLRDAHPGEVAILGEDSYYRRRDELTFAQRSEINYDHPDAIEYDLLRQHLGRLREGHSVEVPCYDYSQHNRTDQTLTLAPPRVLILEGILILHRVELRQAMDLKVFVDVPLDICLTRRLQRDLHERGRDLNSVLAQYHRTVRPMYFEFVQPSRSHADLIVPRGGQNEHALAVLFDHLDRRLAGTPPAPALPRTTR